MLDSYARKIIDPPLNAIGRQVAAWGISANFVTAIGLGLGLLSAVFIGAGLMTVGLIVLLLSRFADGLDGAVARATKKTDFGGYFDIVADFFFYGAIPFAFIVMNPQMNAIAGSYLLLSFFCNGSSFLGFAILAEKHAMETTAQGQKTLYYSNGLLEGTETILFFVLICLFPSAFVPMAWVFGTLCFATAILRIYGAQRTFTE